MIVKQVMIVEDNGIVLSGLLIMLRRLLSDCSFLPAHNGYEALGILQEQRIDLIVTDLNMPVMDGFGLISHTRRSFPEIPVFVMTAAPEQTLEKDLFPLGVSGIYYKPFDVTRLSRDIAGKLFSAPAPGPELAFIQCQ